MLDARGMYLLILVLVYIVASTGIAGATAVNASAVGVERELAGAGGLIDLAARRLFDASQMTKQRRAILAARAVRLLIC